ncbi:MAG: ABC transporter permease [Candidatus Aminicenantes bacterium]
MLKNYLKIAYRNILRNKKYAFLNITGLAVGLAACLLMAGFVIHELTFENMHPLKDRIHRINGRIPMGGQVITNAVVGGPLGPACEDSLPEVGESFRVLRWHNLALETNNREFDLKRVYIAEPEIFTLFHVPLQRGNPDTALNDPFSVVIDVATAERLFGDNDPVGQMLRMTIGKTHDFKITGIMKNIPSNTVLRTPMLISFATLNQTHADALTRWDSWGSFTTFVLLQEHADSKAVEEKITALARANLSEKQKDASYYLQPFGRIYIDNAVHGMNNDIAVSGGGITRIAVFAVTALLILIIASINFINLSTAKISGRLKEVGVRKTCGANRRQLMRQFLMESLLLSGAAMVLGMGLFVLFKPRLDQYLGMALNIGIFSTPWLLPGILGLALLVGFLAGSYPAFLMSRFPAAVVFRSRGPGRMSRSGLRRILVGVQFFIAVILIAWTMVVLKQIRYTEMRDPGYDRQGLILLKNPEGDKLKNAVILRNQILNRTDAVDASYAGSFPYGNNRNVGIYKTETTREEKGDMAQTQSVDARFVPAMGLEVASGRNFEEGRTADEKSILVNQRAAEEFGLENPVGQILFRNDEAFRVIGVVKDWNTNSIHSRILPVVLHAADAASRNLVVRLPKGRETEVLAQIRETWFEMLPGQIFDYAFVDELDYLSYESERRLAHLLVSFCLLTVFVAGLGIFGLASYSVEQRTKEIGIRKALGSSSLGIVSLLTKNYTRWVLAANLLAWPAAYYAAARWLQGFAYRTSIGVEPFLIAGGLTLAAALVSVVFQTLRAASANPAAALRYE